MIADLDETLEQLLIAELPIKNGDIEVSFDQPKADWSAGLTRPTVNLFLYDVRENPLLRAHQWEQLPKNPSGGNGSSEDRLARLKRTPHRVDCLYMLTCWVPNHPQDEHRLLTRAMLALFRFPVLPADRLIGSLKEQPFDLQTRLASHDRLTNPAEVWSALENEMRPSVSYIITLAMDPWMEVTGPVVRTVTRRTGQAHELPRYRRLAAGTATEMLDLGGLVRQRAQGGAPYADIQVAIKGTGLFASTDAQGRYILGGLPPGEYTLVAWPPEGKPVERRVTLPGEAKDYEFEL